MKGWAMDTGEEVIRVLIADDHTVVRGGLVALLDEMPEVLVVGEASDGIEVIELARMTQPDVILLDLMMPRKTGIEAIPHLKKVSPHSKIVILTSYFDDEKTFAAIREGAMGYLLKETSTTALRAAIRHAHQGLAWLDPAIARRLIRELNRPTFLPPSQEPLTDREAEVLILVARGLEVADIADKLVIHEQTVRRHITNILTKFWQGPGPHDPLEPPLPLPIPVR
jgi:NarL family two-component system response regulator LiaR